MSAQSVASLATSTFESNELVEIESLIKSLQKEFKTTEDKEFANACHLVAQEMPRRIRKQLNDFRNQRIEAGYLLLQGFEIDDEWIGPTPAHWDAPWIYPRILREEIFQCLISSCMGDLFGWRTQENGRYLRHIVPIEKDKNEQLGGSSNVVLLWHIEEAFHPQRADMMTIMCYRNEEHACTNICAASDLEIPSHYRSILSQPRFYIEPDKSHMPENNISEQWQLDNEDFARIRSFLSDPKPIPVFQGRQGSERLQVDEAFMHALPGDLEAQEALQWLFSHMNQQKHEIVMKPGDILLIDNRMTVHGRSPYVPNYGPRARWLRRVNITTDLCKSYQWKESPYDRVIF
jgi:Fe(II)/alpha-ketoglutarate-dependent arginine beta-hydroxylase